MNKNKVRGILILVVLLSFICGALGCFLVVSNMSIGENKVITLTTSGIMLTESNSISSGVDNIKEATVVIEGVRNNKVVTGTGFVFEKTSEVAYIITNHHVIDRANDLKVILSDNTILDTEVKGSEVYSDIAVLAVSADKIKSVAVMGDVSKLNVGDTLFAIGAPNGSTFAGSVTKGILSGKDRLVSVSLSGTNQNDYYMKVLQTDAAINPGNSGGPICNINGEVIGVTNMKLVDSTIEGMGFAIPIEDALFYANILKTGKEVVRPYLGVGMCDVNDTSRLFYNQILLGDKVTYGVVVLEVAEGSPAAIAKLKKGDVIVSFGGEKIKSLAHLRYELYKHTPSEKVEVKYIRNGKEKTVTITLTENNNK